MKMQYNVLMSQSKPFIKKKKKILCLIKSTVAYEIYIFDTYIMTKLKYLPVINS